MPPDFFKFYLAINHVMAIFQWLNNMDVIVDWTQRVAQLAGTAWTIVVGMPIVLETRFTIVSLNWKKTNQFFIFIYFRKYEQCRRSINIPSIKCTGYEPYEYSWTHKDETNGIKIDQTF